MRRGGIFETFTRTLEALCDPSGINNKKTLYDQLFLYRHFSMNQFTIDLYRQAAPEETIKKALDRIGRAYRKRIFKGKQQ
jgi:hypothetical protein